MAIRYLILAVVQLGLVGLAERFVIPYLNKAIEEVMVLFGVNREEAQDVLANEIIQYAESVGVFAAVLKTKMPVKVAEMLGFTSKGFNLRKLSSKVPASAKGKGVAKKLTNTNSAILTASEATVAVQQAVKGTLGFKVAYDMVLKTVGVGFMGFMVVGNWLDFGNWNSGAYQKTMQKFIEWISFGKIVPDQDYRQSKTASADVFTKVFETFKLGGAVGIQDPYKGVNVPFTRDNMLDLVDQVGASLLLTTGAASTKNLLKAMLPMIIFIPGSEGKIDGMTYSSGGTTGQVSTTTKTVPKVFTGVVSQGVVGKGLVFTARPDDLIESVEELRTAAANNLAPYLNTVLGKIVYEVKVVSSILTKEGFKQTGTTQQIQTGTWANGQPKYKTVTNKFATIIVYAITDKGSRAKLTTIVLGPVDSAKLVVGQNDLRELETNLSKEIITNDVQEVLNIQTEEKIAESIATSEEPKTEEIIIGYDTRGIDIRSGSQAEKSYIERGYKIWVNPNNSKQSKAFAPIKETRVISMSDTVPVVSAGGTKPTGTSTTVATLSEWYQTQGQTLPSVSVRSQLYASLGLGQASYYTGTAEQNTKLLNALKSGANTTTFIAPTFNPSIEGNALRAS